MSNKVLISALNCHKDKLLNIRKQIESGDLLGPFGLTPYDESKDRLDDPNTQRKLSFARDHEFFSKKFLEGIDKRLSEIEDLLNNSSKWSIVYEV